MSNGLTSVFINTFGLSGSRLANTEDEIQLVTWVMEKNQTFMGLGTVSFNICEMPWEVPRFEEEKQFILSVLDGIKQRLGWETLGYQPNEQMLFDHIEKFCCLIQKTDISDINPYSKDEWVKMTDTSLKDRSTQPKCEIHGTYLTCFGCEICTD